MTSIDFVGREITVGATVIYPRRRGSEMWLASGRVADVRPGMYETEGTVQVETSNGLRDVPVCRCVVQV
jgi:hypothetical protein